MFTTGNHLYLYVAAAIYGTALALSAVRQRRLAQGTLIAGLAVHALYLVGRGWMSGVFYANPIFEGPFFLPWCVALVSVIASASRREIPFTPLLVLTAVFIAAALAYAKGVIPPTPKKTTALAALFFLTENLGHALFYCGAVLASVGAVRGKEENWYHSLLVWGFVLFSVSQVVGAAWCYVGWGNTFRWSPRHFTSAAIWLLWAAYLHLRFTPGWSARRKVIFVAAAAVLTMAGSYGHYLRELAFQRIGG
jgi:ABC-type transport system involved in cytochrome c biogenesis permease subunit